LRLPKFVPRGVLGKGGSGVVVRALDQDILREVAIKVMAVELPDGGPGATRFVEEARITGQLEHPNVVPVYEFATEDTGRRYLCMKLVEGENLEDVITRVGEARLDPEGLADFLQIFVKVCDAVSFAHSRGVIHRDLKPSNVMVSDFGQVYVLDWGIARIVPVEGTGPRVRLATGEEEPRQADPQGTLVGTPCYMAPEQLQGNNDQLDARTDVFALGGTLYQILTGQPPLTPDMVRAIRLHQQPAPIARPEQLVAGGRIPPELTRIVLKAMAFAPSDRYPSVGELKRDVERFRRGAWHLPRVSLPAGSTIVRQGDPGNAAYIIQEGRCAAYHGEGAEATELRIMGPGEVFGETAIFSDKPRTASVKALSDVVLLEVTREILSQAVGLNSWMGAFIRALADRFREIDERLRAVERAQRDGPPPLEQ
jgi:serine/threonine-protein kinase